jgi:tripartite ATP-independent transporter DctM subunit
MCPVSLCHATNLTNATARLPDQKVNPQMSHENTDQHDFLKSFINAFPIIIAAPLILFAMFIGIFSPSEAGAAGVVYVLVVEIMRGEFRFAKVRNALIETYHTVAGVLMIVAIASFFTKMLTLERFPELITTWFLNISHNRVIILLVINLVILIVGMFIDTLSALLLLTPILLQVTKAFGVDPLYLGVILVYNLMIGMFTPRLGIGVFTVAHVGKVAPDKVFRELVSLYSPLLISLLIITFFPKLTLWLPNFILQYYR